MKMRSGTLPLRRSIPRLLKIRLTMTLSSRDAIVEDTVVDSDAVDVDAQDIDADAVDAQAVAAEHAHPICGSGDACTDPNHDSHEVITDWKPIGSESDLWDTQANGHYYLTDNVVLTSLGGVMQVLYCV